MNNKEYSPLIGGIILALVFSSMLSMAIILGKLEINGYLVAFLIRVYPGFELSIVGILLGYFWALLDGMVIGACLTSIINRIRR